MKIVISVSLLGSPRAALCRSALRCDVYDRFGESLRSLLLAIGVGLDQARVDPKTSAAALIDRSRQPSCFLARSTMSACASSAHGSRADALERNARILEVWGYAGADLPTRLERELLTAETAAPALPLCLEFPSNNNDIGFLSFILSGAPIPPGSVRILLPGQARSNGPARLIVLHPRAYDRSRSL